MQKCNQGVLSIDTCRSLLTQPAPTSPSNPPESPGHAQSPNSGHPFAGIWKTQEEAGGIIFNTFWKIQVNGNRLYIVVCGDRRDLERPQYPTMGDCHTQTGEIALFNNPKMQIKTINDTGEEGYADLHFKSKSNVEGEQFTLIKPMFPGDRPIWSRMGMMAMQKVQ